MLTWKGACCTEYGIHISEQPSVSIPAERAAHSNVPGRPAGLTMLEGDDVYDDQALTPQPVLHTTPIERQIPSRS